MGEIWQIKTKGRDLKSLSFVARKYCKKWDFLIDFQTHCDKLIFLSSIQSGFTVAWSLLCSQSLFVYRENLPSKSNFHNQRPKPCRHPFKSTRKKKFSLKFLIQNMYVVFFLRKYNKTNKTIIFFIISHNHGRLWPKANSVLGANFSLIEEYFCHPCLWQTAKIFWQVQIVPNHLTLHTSMPRAPSF